MENFDGDAWGNNGPGCITRVLKKVCQTDLIREMTRRRCFGFNVYPAEAFYAVEWDEWTYFFDEKSKDKAMKLIENSTIVHVWNKLSSMRRVKVGSQVAYGLLAEQYCPKVYAASGEYF